MGKGDIKSRRGKIANGSYGVTRKRKKSISFVQPSETEETSAETKVAPVKKAAPKKSTSDKKVATEKKTAKK